MARPRQLPHLLLQDAARTEKYSFPTRRIEPEPLPPRDRVSHAERLTAQLERARVEAQERSSQQAHAWALPAKRGVHLEFESEIGFGLALKSLDDSRQGIELIAVRESFVEEGGEEKKLTLATVYVSPGKLGSLERKIRDYASKDTKKGKPRHQRLVAPLAELRLATLRSFWTDEPSLFPQANEGIWWEVWLRSPERHVLASFAETMAQLGVQLREESLEFLDTRVLLAYGTSEQLSASVDIVDTIAELRRAKVVPSVFMEIPRRDLGPWIEDLIRRTEAPPAGAPRLCLHDTGVNAGHPLLRESLRLSDCHAVDPGWRVDDHDGHGT